ncbi:Neutral/alkaline nonlysosomal ceramidase [Aulographum hederae CBS 113979]|uniref:Neutral ceramidase n=1 Tax=Aulographum hederae CBS 113979 TaxID=1176131 RepID=A0A6G1GPD6_9PEZI|nr:Neutral/alkaline nonlysosomal ceramidase [Aulographum hederae CBS 113979]
MVRSPVAIALIATITILLLSIHFLNLVANYGDFHDLWNDRLGSQGLKTDPRIDQKNAGRKASLAGDQYLLGVGKADITGPVVELNLMGYANTSQIGSGLRQRLYSRAFIVGSTSVPTDRFVYLVLDTQSGDTATRHGILEALANLGQEYALYGNQNVAVTGTHSHSGPAAWLNYLLPQITSKGFDKQSYQAIVDGAVLSIKRAHESLGPGRLSVGMTNISDANINRSLFAYLANPASEREKYTDNVDKTLTLLRFQREQDGKDIGVLTWFSVHGTNMLGNNSLITGDNKGVAAYLFEKSMAANTASNAAPGFVAGFSQSSVGDTTPNVNGAYCEDGADAGQECKLSDSTCDGRSQACHGRGPLFGLEDHGTASCFEIGRRQFAGAFDLYTTMVSASTPVAGGAVKAFHTFTDFSNYEFAHPDPKNKTLVRTCPAALGYSFAAGTSDGPGAFDFTQNDPGAPNASPVWGVVSSLLHAANQTQQDCQSPKPILLDVGETHLPYDWSPNIVDVQAFRIGQLYIIVSPGEATTMSGRRWKSAVAGAVDASEPVVVLGGPANSYTHYIATPEEYGIQRYEGASTLYGPYTLNAYINVTLSYLHLLDSGEAFVPQLIRGPLPQINTNRSLDFISGVVMDGSALSSFGQVISGKDVKPSYKADGSDGPVTVNFVAANPRNNLHLESTYVSVEKQDPSSGQWTTVRDDSDWDLVMHWERTSTVLGTSQVQVVWEVGKWNNVDAMRAQEGRYRIKYFGDSRSVTGTISPFIGTSEEFRLVV